MALQNLLEDPTLPLPVPVFRALLSRPLPFWFS